MQDQTAAGSADYDKAYGREIMFRQVVVTTAANGAPLVLGLGSDGLVYELINAVVPAETITELPEEARVMHRGDGVRCIGWRALPGAGVPVMMTLEAVRVRIQGQNSQSHRMATDREKADFAALVDAS
jgi:hypothetical protein